MEGIVEARGKTWVKNRYMVAALGSLGMCITYGLKVNLHVAMVSMVNYSAIHNTTKRDDDGPFKWSEKTQGMILSSYYCGYMIFMLPAGKIASATSAKWSMLISVLLSVLCCLLSPAVSKLHYGGLLTLRVIQGLCGAISCPAMHVMMSHWAPLGESSIIVSLVYSGTSMGIVVYVFTAGLIAHKIGWAAIFYLQGGISALWIPLWWLLIYDTPVQTSLISQEERDYILDNTHAHLKTGGSPLPWKRVFTSVPFWAIMIAHVCGNWTMDMCIIELPRFMKQVLKFDISKNGQLTALPYLCMAVFMNAWSLVLDQLRHKKVISITVARKISTGFGAFVPLTCFLILSVAKCETTLTVALLLIGVTSFGAAFSGHVANHIDIAPNYAGILMAITNFFATIPAIIVPVIVGALTEENPTIHAWRIVFGLNIALSAVEGVCYSFMASGEEQDWNNPEPTENLQSD